MLLLLPLWGPPRSFPTCPKVISRFLPRQFTPWEMLPFLCAHLGGTSVNTSQEKESINRWANAACCLAFSSRSLLTLKALRSSVISKYGV